MCGRRGTFGTFIDVRGSSATTVDPWTPTVFYVAGVQHTTLLRLDLRGRRSTFSTFIDVRGSSATTVDPWTPTVFYVAGVQHTTLLRLDLRGRRGTFGTFIDVRGSLATNWVGFGAARCCVAGVALSAPQAHGGYGCGAHGDSSMGGGGGYTSTSSGLLEPASIDVHGSLATNWVGFGAAGSCVAGVTLSAPQARFAWQAWYFRYLHRRPRKLGDELGRIWRRPMLRGRRGTFSTSGTRWLWMWSTR